MNYTIKPHKGRWLASDGIATAEGDDPADALFRLTEPVDMAETFDALAIAKDVQLACLGLITLLAIDGPDEIIRGQVQAIQRRTERYLALPRQTAEEC